MVTLLLSSIYPKLTNAHTNLSSQLAESQKLTSNQLKKKTGLKSVPTKAMPREMMRATQTGSGITGSQSQK